MRKMLQRNSILVFAILGLSCYAVGTLPDYVAEDANTNGHLNLKNCGNGRVDPGEECDCGPGIEHCRGDMCCQTNCQLKLYAQCSFEDPCCDKCKYKSKDSVCQVAAHDCEISEYCTGHSGSCPSVSLKRNGASCTSKEFESGICIYGICKSFSQPCQDSWRKPESKSLKECPFESICYNQTTCVPIRELVNGNVCSKGKNGLECSGQGDCTIAMQCHCNFGWKGRDCSIKDDSNGTRINDERPGKITRLGPEQRESTSDTTMLVGALVTFVIVVSCFFVLMAIKYLPSRFPKEDNTIQQVRMPPEKPETSDNERPTPDDPRTQSTQITEGTKMNP